MHYGMDAAQLLNILILCAWHLFMRRDADDVCILYNNILCCTCNKQKLILNNTIGTLKTNIHLLLYYLLHILFPFLYAIRRAANIAQRAHSLELGKLSVCGVFQNSIAFPVGCTRI